MKKSILILIGSPRLERSTSHSLADYVLTGLHQRGWKTDLIFSHNVFGSPQDLKELKERIRDVEIIGLSFPLYVDGIPGPMVKVLSSLCKSKNDMGVNQDQKVFSMVNSGFPEPVHSFVAVEMCKQFSKELNASFLGGLTFGAGPIVQGRPIEKIKKRSSRLVKTLDETIIGLDEKGCIPDEAKKLVTKPIFPKRLYLFLGKKVLINRARKNNVKDLYEKPDL